jgi:hypothetical protein
MSRNLLSFVCLIVLCMTVTLRADTVYFLVSEFPEAIEKGDSYVLPLENPADIAHARDLVLHGRSAGKALVDADMVAGADNINRNILALGKPAWSWHISHFNGFNDLSLELNDFSPTQIEEDVQGYIDNTGGGNVDSDGDGIPDGNATVGHIAFWNYTVTHELIGPPTDLRIAPAATVPLPAALPVGAATLALIAGAHRLRKRV